MKLKPFLSVSFEGTRNILVGKNVQTALHGLETYVAPRKSFKLLSLPGQNDGLSTIWCLSCQWRPRNSIKMGQVHEAWESGDGPGGQYAGCEAVICQRHS